MTRRSTIEPGAAGRWEGDPAVQSLRKIFAGLEKRQGAWLVQNRISVWDPRLGPARRLARDLLEQRWLRAGRQGLSLSEEELATIYLQGLKQALTGPGLDRRDPDGSPGREP